MRRHLLFLVATFFCAQVIAETRVDASTEETFNESLNSMRHELTQEKLAQLNGAVMLLPFAGVRSFKDTPPNRLKLDIKKLDGMTADQIIELAHKTVTVKISAGPPPGLPEEFRGPLRPVSDTSAAGVSLLAGTQWIVTDNINGNVSEQRVKLQPDGKVDYGSATSGRWEQRGTAVRIAFNDNYAVYLGVLDESDNMQGKAANVTGTEWTWVAKRSDPL